MKQFVLDGGWHAALWAAEPLLANPVVFSVEHPGSVLVCETWRQSDKGVPDNRDHPHWLNDDLSAQTVRDRENYYKKHYPAVATTWATYEDRIVRVEDRNGDGLAETSSVFAGGFKELADGTGSGVLNLRGRVLYTCIPHLWSLSDRDGDGSAEERTSLAYGFGVRTALRGHDMHGLVLGPEGRIYWSIGDRGYNLRLADGRTLCDPGSGAVFRCFPDGSGMEVVSTGLRNPQELAFDDRFDLFTVDNNSDHEDKARIVQIVEGGETGWRMNFQTLSDRGPWVKEGWWKPRFEEQASFLIPTIANLGNGPSGLSASPGPAFGARYDGVFLLADFLGGRSHSGVRAFRLENNGAGYRLGENWHLVKGVLATDVEYGPDGAVWISDWVDGWVGTGKGRIYRLLSDDQQLARAQRDLRTLLERDLEQANTCELELLLAHSDRRVRQRAHGALAARGAVEELVRTAREGSTILARLHGLFGLWQLALGPAAVDHASTPAAALSRDFLATLLNGLATDADLEMRRAAARVAGDLRLAACAPALREQLQDHEPRVRFAAAIALGRIADPAAVHELITLAAQNADQDALLRHAARMGLAGAASAKELVLLAKDERVAVRRVAVLALRRQRSAELAHFLADADSSIRMEAARAIYDVPVMTAYDALAALLAAPERHFDTPQLLLRAIAAAAHFGSAEDIGHLAHFVASEAAPELRRAALSELVHFDNPPVPERVLNEVRGRLPRTAGAAEAALVSVALPAALRANAADLLIDAVRAAKTHWSPALAPLLTALAKNPSTQPETRLLALQDLAAHGAIEAAMLRPYLAEKHPQLRVGAAALLARIEPLKALPLLGDALLSRNLPEVQAAVGALATVSGPEGDHMFAQAFEAARAGGIPRGAWLDLVEAGQSRGEKLAAAAADLDKAALDTVAAGLDALCLEGGDAEQGRRIFLENTETSCTRCHLVKGLMKADGFRAGPELTHVGAQRTREHLLQSVLMPSAVLTEGWVSISLETRDDGVISGRLMKETADGYELECADTGVPVQTKVAKSNVISRFGDTSAMPSDVSKKLTRRQLRDLVEFLATRR
jgi:quinoprotein glucose dehydrogenase